MRSVQVTRLQYGVDCPTAVTALYFMIVLTAGYSDSVECYINPAFLKNVLVIHLNSWLEALRQ